MKSKKLWVVVVAVLVIVAFLGVKHNTKNDEPQVQRQVIQIGALLPLTGNDAFWGQNIKNGVELARDELR